MESSREIDSETLRGRYTGSREHPSVDVFGRHCLQPQLRAEILTVDGIFIVYQSRVFRVYPR